MSLGCNELTDDQILDLLKETLDELASRHHIVREHTQRMIKECGGRLADQEKTLTKQLEQAREAYLNGIRKDVKDELQRMIATGELRVMTPLEEANYVSSVEKEEFLKIVEDVQNAQEAGGNWHLWIHGGTISATFGSRTMDVKHNLTQEQIHALGQILADMILARPSPIPVRKPHKFARPSGLDPWF